MSRTHVTALALLLCCCGIAPPGRAQATQRNPLLEYCTGTWSANSPCAHRVIETQVLPAVRNVIVLAYHGPANSAADPFSVFPGNGVLPLLGFTDYPSGMVDRAGSPATPDTWLAAAEAQSRVPATVHIALDKTFDTLSRELTCFIAVTPLVALDGFYRLQLLLTENTLKYPQAGGTLCPGGADYQHDNVVRAVVNGPAGSVLNTTTGWGRNAKITVPVTALLRGDVRDANCRLTAVVYKVTDALAPADVQQAQSWELLGRISGIPAMEQAGGYHLGHNYPNPLNPVTTLLFSIPRREQVRITLYTATGAAAGVLLDELRDAGEHRITVNLAGLPTGNYFYRMEAGSFSKVGKLLLLK